MEPTSSHDRRGVRIAAALGVFLAAFLLYLRTLAPTVALVDSGELTIAAWGLGNAHPPGFPLFLMLTHLVTALPFGSVAWRANLASAFFSAVAAAMLALACGELLLTRVTARAVAPREESRQERRRRARAASVPAENTAPERRLTAFELGALMLAGGLLFACSRTLWAYATLTEVYALNTAMMAAIVWMMLAWRRRADAAGEGGVQAMPWLYGAALLFGLALGIHHVTIGLGIVALGILVGQTAGWDFYRSRRIIIAAAIAIAGLLVYVYLPLSAAHKPLMNWGNPDDLGRFWAHVTARQYRSYINTTNQGSQLGDFFRFVFREYGPPWLPIVLLLAAAGFVRLWRRDRTLFWYLALFLGADFAWVMVYPIVNDKDAYLLPTFLALTLAAIAGVQAIVVRIATENRARLVAIAALLLPLLALGANFGYRDRSHFTVGKDYVDDAFDEMAPNAMVLTGDWQLYSPMRYFLDVEHRRPDVVAIETGFLLRGWYFDHLAQRYPSLVSEVRPQLEAFVPLVDRFENHQDEWRSSEVLRQQFNQRVDDLLLAMIATHLQHGPVYATVDFALSRDERDQNLMKRMTAAYDIVPRGLLLEIMPGHQQRTLAALTLRTSTVFGDGLRYDDDDVVPTEVWPKYRAAPLMRARYLTIGKQFVPALAEYKRAQELDPGNEMIEQEIRSAENQRGGGPQR